MNKWKVAFFVMLVCWFVTFAVGSYLVVDRSVTLGYMRDGYSDCEAHRDFLDTLIQGRLSRADIASRARNVKVQMKFDQTGKYVGSHFGASTTAGY